MKLLILLALVAPLVLAERDLDQEVADLEARVARIQGELGEFREIGTGQINKLARVITGNSHCPSMAGIDPPVVPTPPAPRGQGNNEEEEEDAPMLDDAQAAEELTRLAHTVAGLELKIARMRMIGQTQIEIFENFLKATGDDFCPGVERPE